MARTGREGRTMRVEIMIYWSWGELGGGIHAIDLLFNTEYSALYIGCESAIK